LKIWRFSCIFILLLLLFSFAVSSFAAKTELSDDAVRVANEISIRNMRATIARLTALPTRVTGYEAGENAAKYLFDEFQRIGLQNVESQEYEITVPIDHGDGKLRILDPNSNTPILNIVTPEQNIQTELTAQPQVNVKNPKNETKDVVQLAEFKLSCLWPNLVRTSFLPEGIKHKVKENDTLESIAKSYGVDVSLILNNPYNKYLKDQEFDGRDNNSNGQVDEPGEMILFPDKDVLVPIPGVTGKLIYAAGSDFIDFNNKDVGGFWHVVQPGDTIDNLAHHYRVGAGSILDDVLNLHFDKSNDKIDNNNNGIIDEDGEIPLMEDIANWYRDGIDNDNDGMIDEVTGDEHDGVDNNKNGQIDEPGEFVEANESSIFIPQGSIVMLDFNCTTNWINSAMLGASAIIFIEPEDTIRGEAEAKFLTIPAATPRFWISKKDADYLLKEYLSKKYTVQQGDTLESIATKYNILSEKIRMFEYNKDVIAQSLPVGSTIYIPDFGVNNNVNVQLTATMTWERRLGQNITGLLPGVDPNLKDELVVIQGYFDSMSVVPANAPGADPTCGIAALMEVARVLTMEENRPGRSVMFLATSGHFQGLAGMRAFMYGTSEDLVNAMYEFRDDIYTDLREIKDLGRRIVLAIGQGLLVELPPSYFDRLSELENKMVALRSNTLPDLANINNTINALKSNRRDEIEKRKEQKDTTKRREDEKFTPEDQARLEVLTTEMTENSIQTAYYFEKLVAELTILKDEAIKKCREEEKSLIKSYALPIAKMDVEAVQKLITEHENLKDYSSFKPWMYDTQEQADYLISKLGEYAKGYGGEFMVEHVDEFTKQYSYGRLADRHLDSMETLRLKKARQALYRERDKSIDYKSEEIAGLEKLRMIISQENVSEEQRDVAKLDALIKKLASPSYKEEYSKDELKFISAHLSEDKIARIKIFRKQIIESKGEDASKLLSKEKDILVLARYNAQNEPILISRLIDLAKNDELNRDYTVEEKRILDYSRKANNLTKEEYDSIITAREQLFSKYEEKTLLTRIHSRAVNDVADLEGFLASIDTLDRPTTEQEKGLLRDSLPTLKNSRILNIHKKVGILSRIDKDEYERRISQLMQVASLQDQFNKYYSSLFISIDISSQNSQLGVFGKGWFYDQEPEFVLRREFASIGNKCAEYATNANFGRNMLSLQNFTDDQIRRAAIAGQWGAASATKSIESIEGKTFESLVADNYDTLVGLGGVNRLMKLQFQDMKERGEPSKEMLKDMDYLRKEVARFIRSAIRDQRKARKSSITLYRKLDDMLSLKNLKPEELSTDEVDDVNTLIGLAGAGSGLNFVNAISATGGKTWRTYIPGKIAFDSEVATLAGRTGIAFATTDDARVLTDTPLDTLSRVNYDNLLAQTRILSSILVQALRDPEMPTAAKVGNYYCTLFGNVVEFDAKESPIPNTPVPYTVVTIRGRNKSMMGVRGDLFTTADSKGKFQISGLGMEGRAVYRPWGAQEVEAYKLDAESGDIAYAPDQGVYGAKIFSNKIPINTRRKGARIVVFPCVSTTIYDLVDQRYYRTLRELSVYDAITDGEPMQYGFSKPWPQPMVSYVEPIALVYSKPGSRIKIGMGAGLLGNRLLLVKADATDEEAESKPTLYTGKGFIVRENGSIRVTPYVVVRDMWALDEARNDLYKRYGISNDRLDRLHKMANTYLVKSQMLLGARQYDEALKLARAAWGYESRAYPDIKGTGNDVVKGVMFYLAILMPFAFFMERLLFHFANINRQVLATFLIFLAVFGLLSQVHPAFQITVTPLVILLAFIVLALSVLVITIIIRKFEEQLEKIKRETSKIHKADVGRLSASAAAFALGISNMRKRKSRTILTCGTLVILTFTVISFTSVRTYMQSNKTRLPSVRPPYTGMLVRNQYWYSLEEPLYSSIKNDLQSTEVKEEGQEPITIKNPVAGRAWYFSSSLGDQSFVDLAADNGKTFTATALLGMSDTEPEITGIDKSLKWGRWFKPGETYAVILPAGIADALDITEKDVGNMQIKIGGGSYVVAGVLDTSFKDVKDLDGEELTPVDYLLMQQQNARGIQMGGETLEGELQKYLHLTPQQIALLPYDVVINMGGNLKSVAVKMMGSSSTKDVQMTAEKQLEKIMADLMPRIALDVFVGNMDSNEAFLYSSIGMTSFSGMGNLFIPILIAALIVLNTMLGAVYERVKEIGIYSAVGLAPVHVAFLFIAEACVYAVIGGILGYLFGQVTAWALVKWGLLGGLTLNYSSTSTVTSTIIVMIVVLGSTIYPAVKASRMAVPDIERKWKLPEPDGDEWHFDLPFTVLLEESLGMNIFLRDYFDAHADESASDFYTDKVTFRHSKNANGEEEYGTEMMVWLAPYDLGVSQKITLVTVPAEEKEEKDLYKIYLQVHRESGEIASWKRVNRRFLNLLRKQFLLWRTFNVAVRNEYHERGRKETLGTNTGTGDAAGMEPQTAS
jgi:ABC-type antimicrobial peptide transport system permease subunit/LysM repeat protein